MSPDVNMIHGISRSYLSFPALRSTERDGSACQPGCCISTGIRWSPIFCACLGPKGPNHRLSMGFRWFQPQVNPEISCRAAHMVMEHQVLGMIDLGPPSQSQGTCKTRAWRHDTPWNQMIFLWFIANDQEYTGNITVLQRPRPHTVIGTMRGSKGTSMARSIDAALHLIIGNTSGKEIVPKILWYICSAGKKRSQVKNMYC